MALGRSIAHQLLQKCHVFRDKEPAKKPNKKCDKEATNMLKVTKAYQEVTEADGGGLKLTKSLPAPMIEKGHHLHTIPERIASKCTN